MTAPVPPPLGDAATDLTSRSQMPLTRAAKLASASSHPTNDENLSESSLPATLALMPAVINTLINHAWGSLPQVRHF